MRLVMGYSFPLFFVAIGLNSDFRALGGHWLLLGVSFSLPSSANYWAVAWPPWHAAWGRCRSFRVGCGMVSRGEVGLIIAAMAAKSNVFTQSQVALVVAVVVLTTLITPLALRGAFQLKCPEDNEDSSGGLAETLDSLRSIDSPDLNVSEAKDWPSTESSNRLPTNLLFSGDPP